VNLQSSDFELFAVPEQFAQERAALDARWKELQREAHPDKFMAQGAAAQRVAMQWSARINEAYQRLKDPLKRAAYICERHGAPVNAENNTAMPPDFLMQQMAWREALDDANSPDDLHEISSQVLSVKREALQQCEHLLDVKRDYPQAVAQVRAMMFIDKFANDLQDRIDQMELSDKGQ
jgi:molecular chaperone HscB